MNHILETIVSQLIFWSITLLAVNIAWLFYKSRGDRLRTLVIELFLSKIWVYGLAGTYYLCWDLGYLHGWSAIWVRIICNAPMVYVMFKLRNYIVSS